MNSNKTYCCNKFKDTYKHCKKCKKCVEKKMNHCLICNTCHYNDTYEYCKKCKSCSNLTNIHCNHCGICDIQNHAIYICEICNECKFKTAKKLHFNVYNDPRFIIHCKICDQCHERNTFECNKCGKCHTVEYIYCYECKTCIKKYSSHSKIYCNEKK